MLNSHDKISRTSPSQPGAGDSGSSPSQMVTRPTPSGLFRIEMFKNAANYELVAPNLQSIDNAAGGRFECDGTPESMKAFGEMYKVMMAAARDGPPHEVRMFEGAKGRLDMGPVRSIQNTAGPVLKVSS